MKKILLISMIPILTNCSSIIYDALQYDRFITLQEKLEQLKPICGKDDALAKIKDLKVYVDHMDHYASHRVNAPEVASATASINSMVTELASQYDANNSPTLAYCQVKVDNITAGVATIISGLGAQ
jgi:hypothetical protein